jgi:putative endonuclease
MKHRSQQTGQRGEALATAYLLKAGYQIKTTNWNCTYGEIDIVATHDDTVIFVEVRTRHATDTQAAFASIGPRKRDKLIKTAYTYLNAHDLPDDTPWRIDVIGIALDAAGRATIDHAEDALGW